MVEPDEQAFEIVLTRFLDLAALHAHIVDGQFSGRDQLRKVEAERRDVASHFVGVFLEREEHAGLVEPDGAIHEKSESQQGLARAGAAAHQRRPAFRQPAMRDFVEAANSGERFRQIANGQLTAEQFHGALRDRDSVHKLIRKSMGLRTEAARAARVLVERTSTVVR